LPSRAARKPAEAAVRHFIDAGKFRRSRFIRTISPHFKESSDAADVPLSSILYWHWSC